MRGEKTVLKYIETLTEAERNRRADLYPEMLGIARAVYARRTNQIDLKELGIFIAKCEEGEK